MAKAKRKASSRTKPRRTYNPRRHHKKTAAARVHHHPKANTRRKSNTRRTYNPRRMNAGARHYKRRRHNPSLGSLTGLLEKTVTALIGAGLASWAYTLVGPMVPIGGIFGQVGIKLGIAWGLGEAAKRTGFAKHAEMLMIGAAISAGNDVINYALPQVFPSSMPQAVALKPGQALLSPDQTGDSSTPALSELVWAPTGYGMLGDLVTSGPQQAYLYQ